MSECSDYPHKAIRKRLLAAAYGQPCPLCGWPMLRGQRLDLDHVIPRALGGTLADGARITHARCNRSAGASRQPHETARACASVADIAAMVTAAMQHDDHG